MVVRDKIVIQHTSIGSIDTIQKSELVYLLCIGAAWLRVIYRVRVYGYISPGYAI